MLVRDTVTQAGGSRISRAHVPGYKIWDLNKVIIIIIIIIKHTSIENEILIFKSEFSTFFPHVCISIHLRQVYTALLRSYDFFSWKHRKKNPG